MRVLVIGGRFIGAPLVRQLMASGSEVAVLRRSAGTTPESARLIQGDRNRLADCASVIRDFAPQVIVDMILSSGRQAAEIAALAQSLSARVVAVSSMDVYRAWGI